MNVEEISIKEYVAERKAIAEKYGLPTDEIDEYDSNIIISHFMEYFMEKYDITDYIGIGLEFGDIADALNPQKEPKYFIDTYADFEEACFTIINKLK